MSNDGITVYRLHVKGASIQVLAHALKRVLYSATPVADVFLDESERYIDIFGLSKGDKERFGDYLDMACREAKMRNVEYNLTRHQAGEIRVRRLLDRIEHLEKESIRLQAFLDSDYTFQQLEETNRRYEAVLRDKLAQDKRLKEILRDQEHEIQRLKGRLKSR